jgi:HEAT repeat protein/tRNA(Arg) A34 adenosine deaminase TadA
LVHQAGQDVQLAILTCNGADTWLRLGSEWIGERTGKRQTTPAALFVMPIENASSPMKESFHLGSIDVLESVEVSRVDLFRYGFDHVRIACGFLSRVRFAKELTAEIIRELIDNLREHARKDSVLVNYSLRLQEVQDDAFRRGVRIISYDNGLPFDVKGVCAGSRRRIELINLCSSQLRCRRGEFLFKLSRMAKAQEGIFMSVESYATGRAFSYGRESVLESDASGNRIIAMVFEPRVYPVWGELTASVSAQASSPAACASSLVNGFDSLENIKSRVTNSSIPLLSQPNNFGRPGYRLPQSLSNALVDYSEAAANGIRDAVDIQGVISEIDKLKQAVAVLFNGSATGDYGYNISVRLQAIKDSTLAVNSKKFSSPVEALATSAKAGAEDAVFKGSLQNALRVMEGYSRWKFFDYKAGGHYYVNVLNERGNKLLELIRNTLAATQEEGVKAAIPAAVMCLIDLIPSIEHPHTELFVDLLPGLSYRDKRKLFRKQITIKDWFGSAALFQIGRGCYNQCAFCQFETPSSISYMPYPLFVKLLDEYRKFRKGQLVLHRDNDTFQVRDTVIGANFAHYYHALRERGFTYGGLTAAWAEHDRVAQDAAEQLSQQPDFGCDISFNLFRGPLIKAVTANDASEIQSAYERIKVRYRRTLATLKPVISEIGLEFGYRKQDKLIDELTRKMYDELNSELGLEAVRTDEYRMSWLPETVKDRRTYTFLDGEINDGYFIFRPYGGRVEVGYTGNKIISLRTLLSSGTLSNEERAFFINMISLLHRNGYRNRTIQSNDLPESMQRYLGEKGMMQEEIKLLGFDRGARSFLREVYGLYYPRFVREVLAREEVSPTDVSAIAEEFGDVPVPNGIKFGRTALVSPLWIRNYNQQMETEIVFYEAKRVDSVAGVSSPVAAEDVEYVLDIGMGNWTYLKESIRRYPNARRIIGIDRSRVAIDEASKAISEIEGAGSMVFLVEGEALHLVDIVESISSRFDRILLFEPEVFIILEPMDGERGEEGYQVIRPLDNKAVADIFLGISLGLSPWGRFGMFISWKWIKDKFVSKYLLNKMREAGFKYKELRGEGAFFAKPNEDIDGVWLSALPRNIESLVGLLSTQRSVSVGPPISFAATSEITIPKDASSPVAKNNGEMMDLAVAVAQEHCDEGDWYPVGAVLFDEDNNVISVGNKHISNIAPQMVHVQHAERHALLKAERLGRVEWHKYTLAVTIEPCFTCANWILRRGVKKVIFGVFDPFTPSIFMQQSARLREGGIEVELVDRWAWFSSFVDVEILVRQGRPNTLNHFGAFSLGAQKRAKLLDSWLRYRRLGVIPEGLEGIIQEAIHPNFQSIVSTIKRSRKPELNFGWFAHLVRMLGYYIDDTKGYYAFDADVTDQKTILTALIEDQRSNIDPACEAVVVLFGKKRNIATLRKRLIQDQSFTPSQVLNGFELVSTKQRRVGVDGNIVSSPVTQPIGPEENFFDRICVESLAKDFNESADIISGDIRAMRESFGVMGLKEEALRYFAGPGVVDTHSLQIMGIEAFNQRTHKRVYEVLFNGTHSEAALGMLVKVVKESVRRTMSGVTYDAVFISQIHEVGESLRRSKPWLHPASGNPMISCDTKPRILFTEECIKPAKEVSAEKRSALKVASYLYLWEISGRKKFILDPNESNAIVRIYEESPVATIIDLDGLCEDSDGIHELEVVENMYYEGEMLPSDISEGVILALGRNGARKFFDNIRGQIVSVQASELAQLFEEAEKRLHDEDGDSTLLMGSSPVGNPVNLNLTRREFIASLPLLRLALQVVSNKPILDFIASLPQEIISDPAPVPFWDIFHEFMYFAKRYALQAISGIPVNLNAETYRTTCIFDDEHYVVTVSIPGSGNVFRADERFMIWFAHFYPDELEVQNEVISLLEKMHQQGFSMQSIELFMRDRFGKFINDGVQLAHTLADACDVALDDYRDPKYLLEDLDDDRFTFAQSRDMLQRKIQRIEDDIDRLTNEIPSVRCIYYNPLATEWYYHAKTGYEARIEKLRKEADELNRIIGGINCALQKQKTRAVSPPVSTSVSSPIEDTSDSEKLLIEAFRRDINILRTIRLIVSASPRSYTAILEKEPENLKTYIRQRELIEGFFAKWQEVNEGWLDNYFLCLFAMDDIGETVTEIIYNLDKLFKEQIALRRSAWLAFFHLAQILVLEELELEFDSSTLNALNNIIQKLEALDGDVLPISKKEEIAKETWWLIRNRMIAKASEVESKQEEVTRIDHTNWDLRDPTQMAAWGNFMDKEDELAALRRELLFVTKELWHAYEQWQRCKLHIGGLRLGQEAILSIGRNLFNSTGLARTLRASESVIKSDSVQTKVTSPDSGSSPISVLGSNDVSSNKTSIAISSPAKGENVLDLSQVMEGGLVLRLINQPSNSRHKLLKVTNRRLKDMAIDVARSVLVKHDIFNSVIAEGLTHKGSVFVFENESIGVLALESLDGTFAEIYFVNSKSIDLMLQNSKLPVIVNKAVGYGIVAFPSLAGWVSCGFHVFKKYRENGWGRDIFSFRLNLLSSGYGVGLEVQKVYIHPSQIGRGNPIMKRMGLHQFVTNAFILEEVREADARRFYVRNFGFEDIKAKQCRLARDITEGDTSSPVRTASSPIGTLMASFKVRFNNLCRLSLVILLSLVTLIGNNGCMSLLVRMSLEDDKIAETYDRKVREANEKIRKADDHRYLNEVRRDLNKEDYESAVIGSGIIDDSEALKSLFNIATEKRIKFVEAYIKWHCDLSKEVMSVPQDLLKNIGIDGAELVEAYRRLVSSDDFIAAFYAARGLLLFGDSTGKPVFIKGLNEDYNVKKFNFKYYGLPKKSQEEIKKYLAMQSAFALAELGDPIAVDYLKTMLFDRSSESDAQVRAYAAYSLSKFGDKGIVEALIQSSDDPAEEVRLESIRGLSNFNDQRLPDLFVAASGDEDASVRAAAIFGFSRAASEDPNISNLIIEVLNKEQDNNVKIACLNVLGISRQPNARETVKSFLRSEDLQLKQAAIVSLGNDLDDGSIQVIASMLNDRREEVKGVASLAAVSLSRHIDTYPQLRELLGKFLTEGDLDTRLGILTGFAQVNSTIGMEMAKSLINDRGAFTIKVTGVNVPEHLRVGDTITLIIPLVHDSDWPVTLAAFQLMNREPLMPDMIDPVKRLTWDDVNPFVRAAALSTLGGVDSPEVDSFMTQALKDNNFVVRQGALIGIADKIFKQPNLIENIRPLLNDPEWQVRQVAVQVVGKVELPQVPEMLAPRLKDEFASVRLAAVAGFADRVTRQPIFIENIKPLLNDPEWQVRAAAVEVVGRVENPEIIRNLTPRLKDTNAFVRQGAVLTLGANIQHFPDLIGQFKDIVSNDVDTDIRQYADYALKNTDSQYNAAFEKPRSILLLGPGWDDKDPFRSRVRRSDNWAESLPAKHRLENLGVGIRAFNWSGNIQDTWGAQRSFQQYFIDTVNEAVKNRVNLKVFLHSWASPVAGGIRIENNVDIEQAFQKAVIAGIKIEIESYGSPYLKSFSKLESKYPGVVTYKNYYSPSDVISFPSVIFNPLQNNIMVTGVSHGEWFNYSMQKIVRDTFLIDTINRNIDLGNNALSRSILGPSFISPVPLQWNQDLRSVTGFSQFGVVTPKVEIPKIPFITAPRIESPRINIPSAPFIDHKPIFNSNTDGSRSIRFVPVAPPNYYQSPAATRPSYTPPVQFNMPPMRNIR